MKKLLGLLGSITLTAVSSTAVVSCSISKNVDESIDPALEQQNFVVLNELRQHKGETLKQIIDKNGGQSSLFFSNGLDNDVNYISSWPKSLRGSLDSNKWSLLNMLNTKFKLGLKRNAVTTGLDKLSDDPVQPKKQITYKDIQKNNVNFIVDNYDSLGGICVSNVSGSYQENGESPVKTPAASDAAIDFFDKAINLGNTEYWNGQGSDSEPAWQKQVDFLDSGAFVNRTYTKTTTLENNSKDPQDFVQLIMLQNTGVIKGPSDGKKTIIDDFANNLKNDYDALFTTAGDPAFTKDDFINAVFSNMNIFNAQKQGYSVSVQLDCNNLYRQLTDARNNEISIINNAINQYNEGILGSFLVDNISSWSSDFDNGTLPLPIGYSGKTNSSMILDDNGGTVPAMKSASFKDLKFDSSALSSNRLIKNDFLANTFSFTKAQDLTDFLSQASLDSYKKGTASTDPIATPSTYKLNSPLSSSWYKTCDADDSAKIKQIATNIAQQADTTNFDPKKNTVDSYEVDFSIYVEKKTPDVKPNTKADDSPTIYSYNFAIKNIDWSLIKKITNVLLF